MTVPAVPLAQWYLLDADNNIIGVDAGWDRAAKAHGAPGAGSAVVLGQPLFRFISNKPLCRLLAQTFDSVRFSGYPQRLPYRCDSPTHLRQMQMYVQPRPKQQLLVEHLLLHEKPRMAPAHTSDTTRVIKKLVLRCNTCQRISLHGGQWIDPDLTPREPHTLIHSICTDCAGIVTIDTGHRLQSKHGR